MGLIFNGVHSSAFGLGAKIIRSLLPGNSDAYIDVHGRAGSILFPGKPKDRFIPVEFGFMPGSRGLFRLKVWEFSGWLNTEERKILIIDDEPGKYYIGKVEDQVDLEQAYLLGKFTATFRCEPFAYGPEQTTEFTDDAVTVNNLGSQIAPPRFSVIFTAAATEWKVALSTEYIRVVHAFQSGDSMEVNIATGAVLINGTQAMDDLDWQNSRFFNLAPGSNSLVITPTDVCAVTVKYTPRWL